MARFNLILLIIPKTILVGMVGYGHTWQNGMGLACSLLGSIDQRCLVGSGLPSSSYTCTVHIYCYA